MLFGNPVRLATSRSGNASPDERNADSNCDEWTTDFTRYGSRAPACCCAISCATLRACARCALSSRSVASDNCVGFACRNASPAGRAVPGLDSEANCNGVRRGLSTDAGRSAPPRGGQAGISVCQTFCRRSASMPRGYMTTIASRRFSIFLKSSPGTFFKSSTVLNRPFCSR